MSDAARWRRRNMDGSSNYHDDGYASRISCGRYDETHGRAETSSRRNSGDAERRDADFPGAGAVYGYPDETDGREKMPGSRRLHRLLLTGGCDGPAGGRSTYRL